MATNHICSDCWLKHLSIKQGSRYSGYDDFMKSRLEYSYSRCNQNNATAIPPPVINLPEPSNLCFAGEYTTVAGDTCDSIALAKNVSSAALYLGNPDTLANCNDIPAGTELCLPPSCEITHRLHSNETCRSIETNATIRAVVTLSPGDVKEYNPWLDYGCTNLHSASDAAFGHVICLSPQNGLYSGQPNAGDTTIPKPSSGYSDYWTAAPANATVATGTTLNCGEWHVAAADDTCMSILASTPGSTISIFMMVNPSLGTDITACSSLLVTGHAYCAVPHHAWDVPTPTSTSTATTTPSATATPVLYGCYSHTATSPLTGGVQNSDIQDANLMTLSFCANHCQQAGFTLFGLENGSSCFCGNSLSSGTKPTYPPCAVSCPGDSAQKCGGSSSTSLWGLDPLPPAVGAADQPSGALTYRDCRPNAGTTGYSFTGATLISATAMTPQLCGNFCKSRGFMLVAVQNGSECRCALSGLSPAVTPVDDSQCDTPCSGDASKMCGSAMLFNYYYWE